MIVSSSIFPLEVNLKTSTHSKDTDEPSDKVQSYKKFDAKAQKQILDFVREQSSPKA